MDEELDSIINFLNDKELQSILQQQQPVHAQQKQSLAFAANDSKVRSENFISPHSNNKNMIGHPLTSAEAFRNNQTTNLQSQQQISSLLNSYKSNESQKQSEFIIRKTQNKRVMSQIRSNQGQPPKPLKQSFNSSSKKKKVNLKNSMNEYENYNNQPNPYQKQRTSQFIPKTQSNYKQIQSLITPQSQPQPPLTANNQFIQIVDSSQDQSQQENPQSSENPQAPQLSIEQPSEVIPPNLKKKFLVFRSYEDPMKIRPYQPPDRGYYFKLHKCDVKIVRYTLEDNGFRETAQADSRDWTVMWSCSAMKQQIYQTLLKYQKVNHFPQSFYITRKDLMYKQVSKMREIHGQKHFNFIPKTFLLPNEMVYLEAEMEKDKEKLWIAKPAASSQGKGIIVTNKIYEIPQKGTPHIVSEYINNPLLFDGFKFDLRVYVAITCINPLRLYIYDEGLTRFATGKYNNNVIGNKKQSKFTHLTNYSLNKYNPNFVANTDPNADNVGSKWSITALRKAFREQGIDDKQIFKKIEDVVIKTILSAENVIFNACEQYVPFRDNCFELLGFDILIDNQLNPWLLEVNLSPSLNCDSPLDQKIKGQLIADLLTLSGIVPLEQRKASDGSVMNRAKGMYYGAYNAADLNSSSFAYKRDSNTAIAGKRKDKSVIPNSFGDTNGFSYGGNGKQSLLNPKQEKTLVKEAEMEFKRRGKFKRVFPSIDYHYYKQFFTEERISNQVLDVRIMSKRRLSNMNQSAMSMKQKIEYLNAKSNLIAIANQQSVIQTIKEQQRMATAQQQVTIIIQNQNISSASQEKENNNEPQLNKDLLI